MGRFVINNAKMTEIDQQEGIAMPLVPAKCPNCGASLTLDPVTRAAVCPYCQTPFVVEDAVNNYNIQNTVRVEHLHTDKVEIQDSGSAESLLKTANTYLSLNNYISARYDFEEITKKFPYEWRAWWGLIETETEKFTRSAKYFYTPEQPNHMLHNKIGEHLNKLNSLFNMVEKFENGSLGAEKRHAYKTYVDNMKAADDRRRALIDSHTKELRTAYEQMLPRHEALRKKVEAFEKKKPEFHLDFLSKITGENQRDMDIEPFFIFGVITGVILGILAYFLTSRISVGLIVLIAVPAACVALCTVSYAVCRISWKRYVKADERYRNERDALRRELEEFDRTSQIQTYRNWMDSLKKYQDEGKA